MVGFGRSQQRPNTKHQANGINIEEAIKQSLITYQQGNLSSAKAMLDKAIENDQTNSFALGLLATIEKALGNNDRLHIYSKNRSSLMKIIRFSS